METLSQYLRVITRYLKRKAKGFNGYILGLSGGLDSAVVARLAQDAVGDQLLCVIIDIDSHPQDLEDARELCRIHGLKYLDINLSAEYHALVANLELHGPLTALSKINTKVRLRMVTLYALGQTHSKLVLGTDNLDELYTGYFTKHGDGAVDLFVINSLTKGEVREAASLLGVTSAIINKVPTAGLYIGQTDEHEMGITYPELDAYLLGKPVSDHVKTRALALHRMSAHKRDKTPRPRAYRREER
jgi:NAD+ synthase